MCCHFFFILSMKDIFNQWFFRKCDVTHWLFWSHKEEWWKTCWARTLCCQGFTVTRHLRCDNEFSQAREHFGVRTALNVGLYSWPRECKYLLQCHVCEQPNRLTSLLKISCGTEVTRTFLHSEKNTGAKRQVFLFYCTLSHLSTSVCLLQIKPTVNNWQPSASLLLLM